MFTDMKYLDDVRVDLHYALPLDEIVYDFFDALKSRQPRLRLATTTSSRSYREQRPCQAGLSCSTATPWTRCPSSSSATTPTPRARRICEKLQGQHPAPALRDPRSGGHRRQDHRPRDGQGHAQGRAGQVLRRRHHPQEEAAGKAEGGQKEDAPARQRRSCPARPSSPCSSWTATTIDLKIKLQQNSARAGGSARALFLFFSDRPPCPAPRRLGSSQWGRELCLSTSASQNGETTGPPECRCPARQGRGCPPAWRRPAGCSGPW